MKEYQGLIGKLIIAIAIFAAGGMIANAITGAGADIGSQIAAALAVFMQ